MPTPEQIAALYAQRLDCQPSLTSKRPPEKPILRRTRDLVPRCPTLRDLALWSGREQLNRTRSFWLAWQELLDEGWVALSAEPEASAPEPMHEGVIPSLETQNLDDTNPWDRRDEDRGTGPRTPDDPPVAATMRVPKP